MPFNMFPLEKCHFGITVDQQLLLESLVSMAPILIYGIPSHLDISCEFSALRWDQFLFKQGMPVTFIRKEYSLEYLTTPVIFGNIHESFK